MAGRRLVEMVSSSRRTPGPIRRGLSVRRCGRCLCEQLASGGMGPGVRRDEVIFSLHRRVDQIAHQGAGIFALAGALRHEHREQFLLGIDPEEGSAHPAPEELPDRAWEWRDALLGSHRKAQPKTVAGLQKRALNFDIWAKMI